MPVPRAQDVIDRAAAERETFIEFIRSVPDDDWSNTAADGRWQARDYVAHLASIDPLITAWFRRVQSGGDTSSGYGDFSIDDWNEEMILARRETSIHDLLDEMASNRVDLNAALADLTDEQLDSTVHFGGDAKRAPRDVPLHLYLQGWLFHDRWHTEDARRAIAGEPEQPFGDEAFAKQLGFRGSRAAIVPIVAGGVGAVFGTVPYFDYSPVSFVFSAFLINLVPVSLLLWTTRGQKG